MKKSTTAKKYVAIDCHDSTLVVEIVDGRGNTQLRATVPTEADAIRGLLAAQRTPLEIVFEEGNLAQWLYDLLKRDGHRVTVCDPRKNRRFGSKSDRIDTHALVTRLRLGELTSVFHDVDSIVELKELAASYQALLQDSVRLMLRVKSAYRARAIRCRGKTIYGQEDRRAWLEQLPPGARQRVRLLLLELDAVRPLRQEAKKEMVKEARRHPAFKILTSVPLIGEIRAALLIATMATPWRFRTKRQLWGYGGLAVVTSSSADEKFIDGKLVRNKRAPMTRGLNRDHNHVMKEIFKAVAHDGSIREGAWKRFYEARLAEGMRREMAQVTLARKIAAVVLCIWKKGVSFDPELISPTT